MSESKWTVAQWKQRTVDTNLMHLSQLDGLSNIDVVLFGTSMFQGLETIPKNKEIVNAHLPDVNIFNAGCGGDKLCNMLYRLENGMIMESIYQKHCPGLIIVMGGANDVEQVSVSDMLLAMEKILTNIRKTTGERPVHIAVLGMFPRLSAKKKFKDETKLYELIVKYNQGVEQYVKTMKNASYHYAGDQIMKTGVINRDMLVDAVHLNKYGNEILVKKLADIVHEYCLN